MNVLAENCALQLWSEHIREQQIGHGLQTISGRRMPGNINPKIAQLLNQTPNFGTAGPDFGRDFCPAYDDRGVGNEKTDNAPQPGVSLWSRLMYRGRSRPRLTFWP
jgi:hypothetical protein